jgi:hypothetical protein
VRERQAGQNQDGGKKKVVGGRLSVICTERSKSKNKKGRKMVSSRIKGGSARALELKAQAQVDEVEREEEEEALDGNETLRRG